MIEMHNGAFMINTCHTYPESRLSYQAIWDKAIEGIRYERSLLVMDRNKWRATEPMPEVDHCAFNEPGYFSGMMNGLDMVKETLRERFNADKLCQLHDVCVDGVFHDSTMNKPFAKGYGWGWKYGLNWDEMSDEVVAELKNEKILLDPCEDQFLQKYKDFEYLCTLMPSGGCGWELRSRFENPNELAIVHEKINALFDKYYTNIEFAASEDDKLAAIVNLCRALHMFHVFPDGNGRTILFALLPKLLIENGFSLAIVDDPSRCFTGYHTTKEMVDIIKQGMKNYQRVVEQVKLKKYPDITDFDVD